jgi:uncharacterized protein YjbI with pentapeptide repeats
MRPMAEVFIRVFLVGCLIAVVAVAGEQEGTVALCGGPYANRTPTSEELTTVLRNHQAWLASDRKQDDERRANLCQATLQKADLFQANLQGANLQQANLQKANLSGANLQQADLREANLQPAQLGGANLQGANLVEANLQQADLFRAKLEGAFLVEANLQGAFLVEANLQGADLGEANLQGANLFRANLQGANLFQANLQGANLQKANLQKANLSGVNLQQADLREANLQPAQLGGANLQKANLVEANLRGASLQGANLQEADLRWAMLEKVDLGGANLQEADLFRAKLEGAFLVEANLAGALYEPNPESLPAVWSLEGPSNRLEGLLFHRSPAALIALREAFKKAGMRSQERQITYAIEHTRRLQAWNPLWYGGEDPRPWLEQLTGKGESLFSYVLFELPSGYGMVPSRALATLGLLILVFSLVYMVALVTARGRAGIWATWPSDRVYQEEGTKEATRVSTMFFFPRAQARAAGHSGGVLLRGVSVPLIGLYFSLLSAFSLGWRELNVGTWIARVQPREYTLRATGWVRTVSGIQSLLSVYLLALWVLTYFGRPFE